MSLNEIEYINPQKIKKECIKDDYGESTVSDFSNGSTKCGEIFTNNNIDFLLCCVFCQKAYSTINEFGEHLRTKHEQHSNESSNDNSDQGSVHDAIEFEVKYDHSKDDKTIESETEFSCNGCNKSYRSKHSLQRHKCKNKQEVAHVCKSKHSSQEGTRFEEVGVDAMHSEWTSKVSCDLVDPITVFKEESEFEGDSLEARCRACEQNDECLEHTCISNAEAAKLELVPNPDLFCEICNRQFKYKNVFRRHGMQHEVGPLALRNDPNYRKCNECGQQFTNNADWFEHETNHPKTKPFQCTYCQKKFKTQNELEVHTKNHTTEGPVKCDQCGSEFVRYKNLISHINRVHLQVKPFACTMCDKRFPQNAELRVHMRRHTGEKPYQCEECGQSFMVAAKLNDHLKRHAGVRDVQCPVCPMAFVTKKMLRKHMVKHSTERPHVCSTCGNTFSRRKALLAHVKIHMDVKEYVCNLCGKAFAQHAGLYMHKRTHVND